MLNFDDTLHSQTLYNSMDEEILAEQDKWLEKLYDFNHLRPSQKEERLAMLREMLAEFGEGSWLEPPFHANWGGKFLHVGRGVYINFGFSIVDDTHIYLDDEVFLGPNVVIATAGHPVYAPLRATGRQYNLPVHIGKRCWIGAGAILLPGVTVGENTVIGAGSVVTKDIPSDVVAVGNPCRVLRPIGEQDKIYFYRDRKIDWNSVPSL